MEKDPSLSPQPPMANQGIEFHLRKGAFFRVIHADGVIGGPTPHGNLHCTFYNERSALPRKTRAKISEDGKNVKEDVVETIGGVVRELEADVVMSLNSAVSFYFWLGGQIELLRLALGMSDQDWSAMQERLKSTSNPLTGGEIVK